MPAKPRSKPRPCPRRYRNEYRDRLTASIARLLMNRLKTIPFRQLGKKFNSKRERDLHLQRLVRMYLAAIDRKKILDAYRKNYRAIPSRNHIPWSFHVETANRIDEPLRFDWLSRSTVAA